MTQKTAKVSIVCIIAIFLVSCCGIVMAHRANERFKKADWAKSRQQHSSQMFNRGEEVRKGPMDRGPMMRGPGPMGERKPNLTKEEICKTCPICNGTGPVRQQFFGEKREGPRGPDFKRPEPVKKEDKKLDLEKSEK